MNFEKTKLLLRQLTLKGGFKRSVDFSLMPFNFKRILLDHTQHRSSLDQTLGTGNTLFHKNHSGHKWNKYLPQDYINQDTYNNKIRKYRTKSNKKK